jgi:hypothetical protein
MILLRSPVSLIAMCGHQPPQTIVAPFLRSMLSGARQEPPPARGLLLCLRAPFSYPSGACRTEEENATAPRFPAGRSPNHLSSIL